MCDFVVTEAAHLAHEKHVSICVLEPRQRLIERRADLLRWCARIVRVAGHNHWPSAVASVMVENHVASDTKQPGRHPRGVSRWDRRAADSEKHLLRQILSRIRRAR